MCPLTRTCNDVTPQHTVLTNRPQLNLQRDPRWGRNSNSPSEDPFHTGAYGAEVVQGMQGDGEFRLIAAQMKHWTAYSVESNRMGFNGVISVYDLAATYFRPLKMAVAINVSAAMCSYAAINGTPSCGNHWMSGSVLRGTWGFQGVIESDCGALSNMQTNFHYTHSGAATAAAAMNGTCDVECDSVYGKSLQDAVTNNMLQPGQLTGAARRILTHRFKLGLMDPPDNQPYFRAPYDSKDAVNSAFNQQVATEAGEQSVVVVQNPNKILPLTFAASAVSSTSAATTATPTSVKQVAVIGPLGNITDVFLGDYRPAACPGESGPAPGSTKCLQTGLDAVIKAVKSSAPTANVVFVDGCSSAAGPPCNKGADNATVASTANASDLVIVIVGEKTTDNDNFGNTGGEGRDRATIKLPGSQQDVVDAAVAAGKPTVVVVLSGGSVTVENVVGKANVALVYAGFGGENGATALVNVLTGVYNPSGRLPFTVYPASWEAETNKVDMSMQAGSGRTYRYFKGTPVFPFGAGLSYTSFSISMVGGGSGGDGGGDGDGGGRESSGAAHRSLAAGDSKTYTVKVVNTGSIAGSASVLVYVRRKTSSAWRQGGSRSASVVGDAPATPSIVPEKDLVAFDGCNVEAGSSATLAFTIGPEELGLYNDIGTKAVYAGEYTVEFSSLGGSTVTADLTVTSTATLETLPPVDNRPV